MVLIKKSPLILSIIYVLLSSCVFTCGMSLAKLISTSTPSAVILFFRCFFGFIFFLPFVIKGGVNNIKTNRLALHIFRVIILCATMFCTYYAYRRLPITTASTIGFSEPLFIAIFALFFLKEELTYKKWIWILIGYLGVLIVIRPFSFMLNFDVFIALLANILASLTITLTKKLSATESTTTLLFYSNFSTFILSAIVALKFWQLPSTNDLLLLTLVALCGMTSNALYINALKLAKVSFVAPFEYTRLIFAAIIGYLIFCEIPSVNIILGAFIIILSNFFLTREELKATT